MKKIFSLFICLLTLLACEKTKQQGLEKTLKNENRESNNKDYFNLCSNLNIWFGSIQGISEKISSDSIIIQPFAECYDRDLSYELVWTPKMDLNGWNELTIDEMQLKFNSEKERNYPGFKSFCFVYKMVDPDELEDYHDLNMGFPLNVKAYKFENDNWIFLSEHIFDSFSSFSWMKYRIVMEYESIKN
jgi:hypothetical protein